MTAFELFPEWFYLWTHLEEGLQDFFFDMVDSTLNYA